MSALPRTIAEAARLIEARSLSPVALVRGLLQRVETLDPIISSFITVTAESALAQARQAESEIANGRYRGPLHGIPFGAKDNFETRGIRTTGHSKIYEHHVPQDDAAIVDQLHAAGAILLGKLALHELAHGGPSFDLPWPPARNPWHPAHFTGGSSSGSGAALGASLVLFALGSDTGGSIRTPASLCGVVGMKPTFGLVSRYGVIPNCYSLDHCGPMARTVEDCAIVLQAISAHDTRDRSSAPGHRPDYRGSLRRDLSGVRVGVVRHFWDEDLAAGKELANATDEALRVLERLGARLETVRLRTVGDYCDVWSLVEAPETFSIQRANLIERARDFGSVFLERTLIACLIQAADSMDAHRVRSRMVDEMKPVWKEYDVLVTAGAGPAPRLDPKLAAWPSLNRYSPFAIVGAPAIVVPCGYSEAGLPLSIQFVGKPFDDAKLLGIAHAYEQETQWWLQREPALSSHSPPAPITHDPPPQDTAAMDPEVVSLCERAARSAGLRLADRELAILCGAAPRLLEILQRVRLAAGSAEPANVFFFPPAG